MRRESFDWRRKRWLYCFAGQRGPQQANVLKTVLPLEGIRRWLEWNIESQRRIRVEASLHCLSKLVFSGPQDWFWWSSFFPEWRMLHQVVFHLLGVLVLQKGSKYCHVYSLSRTRMLLQVCTNPPWSLYPLPSLISNCPLECREGPGGWGYALKTRNGGHRKACVPRSPPGH